MAQNTAYPQRFLLSRLREKKVVRHTRRTSSESGSPGSDLLARVLNITSLASGPQPRQRVPCLGVAFCRQTEMRCFSRWETREPTSQIVFGCFRTSYPSTPQTDINKNHRRRKPRKISLPQLHVESASAQACLCEVLFARKLGTVGGNVTAHLVGCPVPRLRDFAEQCHGHPRKLLALF